MSHWTAKQGYLQRRNMKSRSWNRIATSIDSVRWVNKEDQQHQCELMLKQEHQAASGDAPCWCESQVKRNGAIIKVCNSPHQTSHVHMGRYVVLKAYLSCHNFWLGSYVWRATIFSLLLDTKPSLPISKSYWQWHGGCTSRSFQIGIMTDVLPVNFLVLCHHMNKQLMPDVWNVKPCSFNGSAPSSTTQPLLSWIVARKIQFKEVLSVNNKGLLSQMGCCRTWLRSWYKSLVRNRRDCH